MKVVLLVLLFYAIGYAKFFAATTCPSSFTVNGKALRNCEEVCKVVGGRDLQTPVQGENLQNIGQYGGLHGYKLKASIGPENFGIIGSDDVTYFRNTCTCVFVSDDEYKEGLITGYTYCSYEVKHHTLKAKKLNIPVPDSIEDEDKDIPTNLVKLFIFDKLGGGTTAGDIILSGLYAVYTQAIRGFSVAYALALTIIIAGWTFGTYFFTNLFEVLRHRRGHLEYAIATDLKRKAIVVLLASLVFLVPVSTNSPILKAAAVGYSDSAKDRIRETTCDGSKLDLDRDRNIIEQIIRCKPIQLNLACGMCKGYIEEIERNCRRLEQERISVWQATLNQWRQVLNQFMQEIPNRRNSGWITDVGHTIDLLNLYIERIRELELVYKQDIFHQNRVLIQAYKMCVNSREKEGNTKDWLQKAAEEVNKDHTYLPIAVAVVKSFISTGLGFAQSVGSIAGDIVQAYTLKKLSKGDSYKALGIPSIEDQMKQVNQMLLELQMKDTLNIDLCGKKLKSCSEFRKLKQEEYFEKKRKDPACGAIIEAVAHYCESLDVKDITSKLEDIKKSIESAKKEQTLLSEQTEEAFNQIKAKMTWLSSAVLPMISIYIQVAKFVGANEDPVVTEIKLVGGSGPQSLSEWGGDAVNMIADKGKGLLDFVSKSTKPLTKDKETVGVGWDMLLKGSYGHRAFAIGRIYGLTAIPPGSTIKSSFNTLLTNIAGSVTDKFSFLAKLVPSHTFGNILVALGKVYQVSENVFITILSAVITSMILNSIPLIAVAVVVIFRFLAFLKDLIKFMLSLPFYAIASATRDSGGVFEAFKELVKLTLMPAVIAFAPLVGFAAVELATYFAYEMPMALLTLAIANFSDDSVLLIFAVGYFTGILYVIVTFLSALIGWEVSSAFVDGITDFIQRVAGVTATSSSRAMMGALTVLRPMPRM